MDYSLCNSDGDMRTFKIKIFLSATKFSFIFLLIRSAVSDCRQFIKKLIKKFLFKEFLLGDSSKAKRILKWQPKIQFNVNK